MGGVLEEQGFGSGKALGDHVSEVDLVYVDEGDRSALVGLIEVEADVGERDVFGMSYIEPIYG
jgi:hypothetical protein